MNYLVEISQPVHLIVAITSPIIFIVESASLEIDEDGNAQLYSTSIDSLISVTTRIIGG